MTPPKGRSSLVGAMRIDARHHLLTADQFFGMVEAGILGDDDRVELLDGELIEVAPDGDDHVDVLGHLNGLLALAYVPAGYVLRPASTFRAGPRSVPQPDFGVVLASVRGVAEVEKSVLVVEVSVSSLSKDLRWKASIYARAGAPVYWVVDVVGRRVHVLEDTDGSRYRRERVVTRTDTLLLPGIGHAIQVRDLFAPLDS